MLKTHRLLSRPFMLDLMIEFLPMTLPRLLLRLPLRKLMLRPLSISSVDSRQILTASELNSRQSLHKLPQHRLLLMMPISKKTPPLKNKSVFSSLRQRH